MSKMIFQTMLKQAVDSSQFHKGITLRRNVFTEAIMSKHFRTLLTLAQSLPSLKDADIISQCIHKQETLKYWNAENKKSFT